MGYMNTGMCDCFSALLVSLVAHPCCLHEMVKEKQEEEKGVWKIKSVEITTLISLIKLFKKKTCIIIFLNRPTHFVLLKFPESITFGFK